jgi:hypothetical protein
MPIILVGVTEREVLLGEAKPKVPQGEQEGEVPRRVNKKEKSHTG